MHGFTLVVAQRKQQTIENMPKDFNQAEEVQAALAGSRFTTESALSCE